MDPGVTVLIGRSEPEATNEHHQGIASLEVPFDDSDEVLTRVDTFKVDKDSVVTEFAAEPLIDCPRVFDAVGAPIADEHSSHGSGACAPRS